MASLQIVCRAERQWTASAAWQLAAIVVIWLQLSAWCVGHAAEAPQIALLNVVVIDTSGSMSPGRLATAVAEIKAKAKQLPPTPETPWRIIPFHSQTYDIQQFVGSYDELGAYLDHLQANGGTCVASGLAEAANCVDQLGQAQHIAVYLYTDGEDPDQAGVTRAIDRLNRLFNDRTAHDLGQTIIVRRWGNANLNMIKQLTGAGNAPIDAGETPLLHMTIEPRVRIKQVQWRDVTLVITAQVECEVRGETLAIDLWNADARPLDVRCLTSEASSQPVAVLPGRPAEWLLTMPLDPETYPEKIQLEFDARTTLNPVEAKRGKLVPSLARRRWTINVDVPLLIHSLKVSARGRMVDAVWRDPLQAQGAYTVIVDVDVTTPLVKRFRKPLALGVEPVGGATLEALPRLDLAGPGAATGQVVVQHKGLQPAQVKLCVKGLNMPADLKCTPDSCELVIDLTPPPPVVTEIELHWPAIVERRWSNLETGRGQVAARLRATVRGPRPATLPLEVDCILGSTTKRLVLAAEKQELAVAIDGPLPMAPACFDLQLNRGQAPPAQGAVTFQLKLPGKVRIAGPPPARLHLGLNSQPVQVHLPHDAAAGWFRLAPTLLGAPAPATASVRLRVEVGAPFQAKRYEQVPIGQAVTVNLAPATSVVDRFFHDACYEGMVGVSAYGGAAQRVLCAQTNVRLVREAAFKFWAVVACAIMLALAMCTVIGVFAWRLLSASAN